VVLRHEVTAGVVLLAVVFLIELAV